ncbi:hypothetical protein SAMN05660464_2586 [Geodermatophilus dictyosporus]|uniref:Protein kinase domain-containing protein n=1 Tax=Geodermatophilus dictyosporus TaxID=1523247 RepID=A0A1I5NLL0_9ACTN|nr:hypothetical protein [Geodermatophilus dictyosporus]SFP22607.1 hypothetical protein SAMN05660464_2586 [Geodermatophilus dictyosporus]
MDARVLTGVGLGLLAPREATRRHLRAGLSIDSFFDELNRRGVRYAVLRWFETLPDVDPGEDVDVLVADEDLPLLRTLLGSHRVAPARQAFDVYSETGLPGSDFRGIPYLSPALAARVLDRAVLSRGRYRVPSPADHFDSLAYHVAYHKGLRSGLPAEPGGRPATDDPEHDYVSILGGLAADVGLSVRPTLADLDAHLAAAGLRPPLDTLEKLAEANPWLRDSLDREFGPADADLPGLAVFVVREQAAGLLDRVRAELVREGWEPLVTVPLDPAQATRVRARVRGGNWGAGPFAVSGGGPAAYVVAFDLAAVVEGATSSPERVTASKLAVRRRLLAGQPSGARFNPLHSSDNARQALDYLDALDDPALVAGLRAQIAGLRAATAFPYPVVELLPSGRRRAVTAVVDHPVFGESVCKVFHPGAHRFLERELRARTEFADLPEVPALLEAGDTWLLSPRYSDTRAHVRRSLPGGPHAQLTPGTSLALARLARTVHARGSHLLDLTPLNLVSDAVEGLKVIDWEFLQDLPAERPPLAQSPTVLGRDDRSPDGDTPLGVSSYGGAVLTVFSARVTGVPARLLLGGAARWSVPLLAEPGMALAWLLLTLRTAVKRSRPRVVRAARRAARAVLVGLARRGR